MLLDMRTSLVHPGALAAIVIVLSAVCLGLAVVVRTTAPAVSLALMGLLAGGIAGFLAENADGPKSVPMTVAASAAAGVGIVGLVGLIAARGRPPARGTRRAALLVLLATPFAGAALTFALQAACPLYVNGRRSGYCNFMQDDLLGGWVSGVVFLFVAAELWLALMLFIASVQATDRAEGRR
jgi:hypothetical protein